MVFLIENHLFQVILTHSLLISSSLKSILYIFIINFIISYSVNVHMSSVDFYIYSKIINSNNDSTNSTKQKTIFFIPEIFSFSENHFNITLLIFMNVIHTKGYFHEHVFNFFNITFFIFYRLLHY